jgi:hypothetical protein
MADRLTAGITPTATIRHMSTMVGKQSKNPGPLASTDLTDTAGGLGAIGKRSADPGRQSPGSGKKTAPAGGGAEAVIFRGCRGGPGNA